METSILITGCSGFLASHLIDRLITHSKEGITLYGLTEVKTFSSPHLHVFHEDIRNRLAIHNIIEKIRPNLTFHLAAIANVGFSWKHQEETYGVNFIGTSNLLEGLGKFVPGSRVMLMSSGELYGGNNGNPCSESTHVATPTNPYALSKVAMEMIGDLYGLHTEHDLEIIKLRAFNFTGPGQSRLFMASDFSYQIAKIEKGMEERVINVGNLTAERDFSDVRDIARYLHEIALKGHNGGIYNLCSGRVFSTLEVLDKLLSFSTVKIEKRVDASKLRPVDVPKLQGDNRLIRESFGLIPNYNMDQTLQDLLDYWRERVNLEAKGKNA